LQSFEFVGLPEGVYPIVEATLYLATAPKSNSTTAYFKAYQQLEQGGIVEVPRHLQDSNRDAEALGHGKGYEYPHSYPDHHIGQGYLPAGLWGTYFYKPSDQGYEAEVQRRLERWRQAQREALEIKEIFEVPDLSEAEVETLKRRQSLRRSDLHQDKQ
jgi:putative ATPase